MGEMVTSQSSRCLWLLTVAICLCFGTGSAETSQGVDPIDCYIKSTEYNGTVSVTISGKTCQAWTSQNPHSHGFGADKFFPNDESVEAAKNYCRDPDVEGFPWCYTTTAVRFEQCDVPICSGLVSIDSPSEEIVASTGQTIFLKCRVTEMKNTQQVKWEHTDQNVTISLGNRILPAVHDKYELLVLAPQDQTGQSEWNLRVFDLQVSDQGTYRCSVVGAEKPTSVSHHVSISGAPTPPPTPNINVTACCQDMGVDSCAIKLCAPLDYGIDQLYPIFTDSTCMEQNLINILQCGRAGRNHVGCCIRSGMADICLPLCDGTLTVAMFKEQRFDACETMGVSQAINCLSEGQFNLPSRPVSVTGISVNGGFVLSWKPPLENPGSVTGYKIQYREKKAISEEFITSSPQNASVRSYAKQQLTVGAVYEVKVMAVAGYRASEPSYTVDVYIYEPVDPTVLNATIKDCCVRQQVLTRCQEYCTADATMSGIHPDSVLPCYGELNTIFSCLIGMRNHTPCCERIGIAPACYPLCAGQLPKTGWNTAACVAFLPRIMACAMEGSNLLPSPPQNTTLVPGSVTSSSFILDWDPPSDNSALDYVVAWKQAKSSTTFYETVTVSGTRHKVTGLMQLTTYEVFVASQNNNGTSLPETSIIVITEAESSGQAGLPYNETNCCTRLGVPAECIQLCNHTFRLTDQVLLMALSCQDAVLPMLQCASDGRDHTQCCKEEGISNNCLNLCKMNADSNIGTTFIACAGQKDILSSCFDEGKKILPKSPEGLNIRTTTFSSITLDWDRPDGPNVTDYKVQYTWDGFNWAEEKTQDTFIVLTKLLADKQYRLRVLSKNEAGTSLPSTQLLVYLPKIPVAENQTTDWNKVWASRSECCANSNFSSECAQMCVSEVDITNEACLPDFVQIVACGADGRNHSECCDRTPGFPEACLEFCSGNPPASSVASALCLANLGSIFTCFSEGRGLLPTPPQHVKVADVTHEKFTVKWEIPAANCNSSCRYNVQLRRPQQETPEKNIMQTGLQYTFTGLDPSTQYAVSVRASNQYGRSLWSPQILVWTKLHPRYGVTVTQYPAGILDNGSDATLGCAGTASQTPISVSWMFNKKTVAEDNEYPISDVNQLSAGNYTCFVTYQDGTTASKTIVLNVRYHPVGVRMKEDSVLPGLGEDGFLSCEYEGFPTLISWTKDGQALQGDRYFLHRLETNLHTGITISVLQIRDVVDDDYGDYTCFGKNNFGTDGGFQGKLTNVVPTETPLPTSSPGIDAEGCCKARGVPPKCITDICTFDIDISTIISNTNLYECLTYMDEYFACVADGRNHTKCCRSDGVDDYCLPFCAGSVPSYESSWDMVTCLTHEDTIFNCLEDGYNLIPSPPRSVVLRMQSDSILVRWDKSDKNADKVEYYKIYYLNNDTQHEYTAQVTGSTTTYLVPSVKKGNMYIVWVIAHNHHGNSHSSNQPSFRVTAITPSKPKNLRGRVVNGVNIHLSWDSPDSSVPVTRYQVHYRTLQPIGAFMVVNATTLTYEMENLLPTMNYSISVVPFSADGAGKQSDKIVVTTGVAPKAVTPKPQADDTGNRQKAVGLAVGLVLALVLIIAAALFALLMYRRVQSKKHRFNAAVAFENPQYADSRNATVTGLPGDKEEDNQYNYTTLREDRDPDHGYSDLHDNSNTATGGAENSFDNKMADTEEPATLNLDMK